jgi:cell wall-associated NlpC family hydrolase
VIDLHNRGKSFKIHPMNLLKNSFFICLLGALILFSQTATAVDLSFLTSNKKEDAGSNPQASDKDSSEKSQTWTELAQEIILNAISQTGVRYKYGGINPETGFDCSGFVRYVFQQGANLSLPRGARAISQVGQDVPKDQLQPGDLVFFNTLKSVYSHVGIYIGNNRFIHSPSAGGTINVTDMNDAYWSKRYSGARHIEAKDLANIDNDGNPKK